MHILIIEDEEQLCRSMAEGLRMDGYETDVYKRQDLVRREISSSESGTSSGSDRFCACTWRILSLNLRRGVRACLLYTSRCV